MARPLSSGCAGQPPSAQRAAIAATVSGSVTGSAVPSTTRSNSCVATAMEHFGFWARLRAFRVPGPVWNQYVSSTQSAPTAVVCGVPSGSTVVSQDECRLGPPESGACVTPLSITCRTDSQSIVGRSYRSARLCASIPSETPLAAEIGRVAADDL